MKKSDFNVKENIIWLRNNGGTEMKKENNMEEIRAELAMYWNYKRNGELKPEDVDLGSSRVVWMQCPDGHEFTLSIREFAMGIRCPYDCGKLMKGRTELSVKYPQLVQDFDAEKNGFGPDEIEFNSKMPLWWKCPNGHSYKMTIKNRKERECPYCGKIN